MNKKVASPITFKFTIQSGWQFHIRIERDKDHVTTRTSVLRNGRAATNREAELWRDTVLAMQAILVKELASAAGEEKLATKLAEWLDQYKKATSLCRSSGPSLERNEAILFLTSWRRDTLAAQESGQKIPDSDQIKLLSPLLIALSKLNAEFFKGLAAFSDRGWSQKSAKSCRVKFG